jgi:hypothetical protein
MKINQMKKCANRNSILNFVAQLHRPDCVNKIRKCERAIKVELMKLSLIHSTRGGLKQ